MPSRPCPAPLPQAPALVSPAPPWSRRCFGVFLFAPLIAWLWRQGELRRQRQALLRLDDRLLRDIGLTREQAEQPPRRPA